MWTTLWREPVFLDFYFKDFSEMAFMASVSARGQERKQHEWKQAQTQKDCVSKWPKYVKAFNTVLGT